MGAELEPTEIVAITRQEYNELRRDQITLQLLEAGGVDNWDWYGESLRDAVPRFIKEGLATKEEIEDYDE